MCTLAIHVSYTCTCTLSPGCVRGTGIRLEDDIVVTEGGAEVLNKGCPETVEEVSGN